jgi:membrane associated rhomboid family serine protease
MSDPKFEAPVNPLPPAVVAVFLSVAGVEAVLSLGEAGLLGGPGAVGWRLGLIRDYGFSGDIFDWMVANGRYPPDQLLRLITYPFIHLGFSHALFGIVLLLALGKLVSEAMGQWAFTVMFFGSAFLGAGAYAVVLDDPTWLSGAYPGVYGLIGGYSFVLWRRLEGSGSGQYRAFSLIAVLMGLQLIWGMLFETGTLWLAELFGFFTGFGLSFVLAPGEWDKLRALVQRR